MKNSLGTKGLLKLTLSAALLASPLAVSLPSGQAAAASTKYKITAQPFSLSGKDTSIGTINKEGATYIALRNLSTGLGLDVQFDKKTQTVNVTGKGRVLEINLNNSAYALNGQPIYGPDLVVQDNTAYLPLRFMLERMGYDVAYGPTSKKISLQPIRENELKIGAEVIGADGDGKSLLVYYPVISGYAKNEAQQKINTLLKQEADNFIKEAMKQINVVVKENNETLKKDPKAEVRQPSLDGRFTVTYNEKGLLSLYVDYYIYLGGAHGDTVRVPYTFDLNSGEAISLKEAANNHADYVSIINSKIKEQIKDRKLALLNPFETIEKDRDFFLSRNGVVIYFTQYEYTSYAEGMPEFVIPYSAFE